MTTRRALVIVLSAVVVAVVATSLGVYWLAWIGLLGACFGWWLDDRARRR